MRASTVASVREMRLQRAAQGLCPRCGIDVQGTGFKYCAGCRQKNADTSLKARSRKPAKYRAITLSYYHRNGDQSRAKWRARYQKRKAAKVCTECGITAVQKFSACLYCRELNQAACRERRARRRAGQP